MKNLKKLLILTVAVALAGLCGIQSANAEENVTVTVTVTGAIGFTLTPNVWGIGIMSAGDDTAMSSPLVIDTSSATQTQTFKLNLTNPSGWISSGHIDENDHDKFVMACRLKDHEATPTPPTVGEYGDNDVLWSDVRTCDGTVFGGEGNAVQPEESLDMYLMFQAPTSVTSTGEKSISVTVASE